MSSVEPLWRSLPKRIWVDVQQPVTRMNLEPALHALVMAVGDQPFRFRAVEQYNIMTDDIKFSIYADPLDFFPFAPVHIGAPITVHL